MRKLALLFATLAGVVLGPPATAETFSSPYAPQPGDRAALVIEKCRDDTQESGRTEGCVRFRYLEEVISATADGYRVRYTMQEAAPTRGTPLQSDPQGAGLMQALSGFALDLATDKYGAPQALLNRAELMRRTRELLQSSNPQERDALNAVLKMFEEMDEAVAAAMFARDFAGLSLFQGVELEIGRVVTAEAETPFPLDPSMTVKSRESLLLERIDRAASQVHGVYRREFDEQNLRLVVDRFIEKIAPLSSKSVEQVRREMGDLRISRSDEVRAVVDVVSGRVTNLHGVSTIEARAGAQGFSRIETITLTRTLPTRRE